MFYSRSRADSSGLELHFRLKIQSSVSLFLSLNRREMSMAKISRAVLPD